MFFRLRPLAIFVLCAFVWPALAFASEYDLSTSAADVSFLPSQTVVGQSSRVTVSVTNNGTEDAEGIVQLLDGNVVVSSKAVSSKSQGRPDDVWMVWRPATSGTHALTIRLIADPGMPDQNLSNNEVRFSMAVDGDLDGDGIGDLVDPDVDGDGAANSDDDYMYDPTRTKKPVPAPVVKPAPTPTPTPAPVRTPSPVAAVPSVALAPIKPAATLPVPAPSVSTTAVETSVPTTTFAYVPPEAAAPAVPSPAPAAPSEPVATVSAPESSTPMSTYALGAVAALSAIAGFFFLSRGASSTS